MPLVALDNALAYLGSELFEGKHYAWVISELLWAERHRIAEWNTLADESGIELQPSAWVLRICDLVYELRGSGAYSAEEIVREALIVLDIGRDAAGSLPPRLINNYMTLRTALTYRDCADMGVIGVAKGVLYGRVD